MKKLISFTRGLRFDYHQNKITALRRQAGLLIDSGLPATTPKLVDISNEILRHGIILSLLCKAEKQCSPSVCEIEEESTQELKV
ncbi:MAG: hypothetical protein RRY54_05570 [Angelakisella sp.]